MERNKIKIAVIDLYKNEKNLEINCIKNILVDFSRIFENNFIYEIFDTRYKGATPSLDYDIYISSGGPGSPWDGQNSRWESNYFSLIDSLLNHNQKSKRKKFVFFICHSFQLIARHLLLGDVTRRGAESFGVLPVDKTDAGRIDLLFKNLPDPFYCADFRSWQVVNPDFKKFKDLGASILTYENNNGVPQSELAVTSIRISNEMAGTQFHPETDSNTMRHILSQKKKKDELRILYGAKKYEEMLRLAGDPCGLDLTHKTVLPAFLQDSLNKLNEIIS